MRIKVKDLMINWKRVKEVLFENERTSHIVINDPKHPIHACMNDCLRKAKALARPRAVSTYKKRISVKSGSVQIEGVTISTGRRLASYLMDAIGAHLFLVTLGEGIEKEASRLMFEGEALAGYLLDRMGSFAVESLAEAMEDKLRKAYASAGKSVSMRLSPGYCDWPVEGQLVMAKILDFSKAGVHLTESCMMVPRKSISAMVGIGPRGLFSKKSQCALCKIRDCDYRRPF